MLPDDDDEIAKRLSLVVDQIFGNTNSKLADALRVSAGTVSRWLNGKNINIRSIQELEKFGVSMHWLIYGDGKMMIKDNEKLEKNMEKVLEKLEKLEEEKGKIKKLKLLIQLNLVRNNAV